MNAEIYRPVGIFIIVENRDGSQMRLPVVNLSVGCLTAEACGLEASSLVQSLGVEVHGEFLEINTRVEEIADARFAMSWSTYSFDFTLFQAWVNGLNITQKEELISDVIQWHEDLESVAHHETENLKRSA